MSARKRPNRSVRRIYIQLLIYWFLLTNRKLSYVKKRVREANVLPAFNTLFFLCALRRNGDLIVIPTEPTPGLSEADAWRPFPVDSPLLVRISRYQAAQAYPFLGSLVPARPKAGVTCASCGGTGDLQMKGVVCVCGGLGWCLPGEEGGIPPLEDLQAEYLEPTEPS